MSNIRLFFKESLSLNLNSILDKSQSHYLSKVMRIKTNESFSLFNQSGEWEAKVLDINKGIVEFSVTKKLRSAENEKEIWLAFAPIKLNYLNLMIQKATEIGITRFIPILTERTVVRKLNEKRINKIIIEASEQSNRLKVPSLDKLTKLDTFLKSNQNTNIIFGDLNTDNKKIDLKILSFILSGIIFFCFKIFSLSFDEKSPSGPIKTHNGFLLLIFIFLFSVFKSPKIIFVF